MRLNDIKLQRLFDAWFRKNHTDLFETDEVIFYGKPDLEQRAYYIAFFDQLGYSITTPIKEDDLQYLTVIFDKHKKAYFLQRLSFDTMDKATDFGIQEATNMHLERIKSQN